MTAADMVDNDDVRQLLEFLAHDNRQGDAVFEEAKAGQDAGGAPPTSRKVSNGYFERFCERVESTLADEELGQVEPICIVDFAFRDQGGLNLPASDALLERAYCFIDRRDAGESERLVVVHAHTMCKWEEAKSAHPRNRAKKITSVNVRHANKLERGGLYKQEYGAESLGVLPVNHDLRRGWRDTFNAARSSELEWSWGDCSSFPTGEEGSQKAYSRVRKVIQLGESLFDGYYENQVWTESNHGPYEFNKIITIFAEDVAAEAGASAKRGPIEASSAAAEPCFGRSAAAREGIVVAMARKKVVEPAAGGVGGAAQVQAVAEWTDPNWAHLQLGEPDPAPWPFKILFVGVNSDELADLCLKREFEKIDAALEAAFGRNSTEKPSLKQIPYAAWNEVLKEIMRYHPTVLHLGCHSNKASGIQLFENTVKPESMIEAIREWNSEAREQSRHQIRVIVVNACESDVHAEKLSQCVDFTIGHHAPVVDERAIKFSEMLYECIFGGMPLQRSFIMAKSAALSGGYRIFAKRDPRKISLGPVRSPSAAIDADQCQAGSKRACNSDNFQAASASKVPRTQGGGSMTLRKRDSSIECDEGGGSSSRKRIRQDSTPGGSHILATGGGNGGAAVHQGHASAAGCGPPWDSIRCAYEYDVFISNASDRDDEGRDNHARAKRLNECLQQLKVKTWFHDEQMQGKDLQRMAEGIKRSAVVLICVTRKYMGNCKLEFEYAYKKRTPPCMLPVVMEESMTDTAAWDGFLEMVLGNQYDSSCQLTSDVDADFDCAVARIAESVGKILQKALRNEMQSAASAMSSRSHSPAPTDMSYESTAPATPQSPQSQEVVAMHVANEVNEFRDDMKKLIDGFLKQPSSEAAEQPALRQWRLCELLLVAFMKNKIAPCPDDEIAENLVVWQEKCEDPAADLITAFSKLMLLLKPSVLNDIGYDFAGSSRQNHTSIFVIDWMVQHSKSALPRAKKVDWIEEVVLNWFVAGDTECADGFLGRAEKFLQKGVKGESWGAKILGKVIQTNSYVIFFRMEALAALLLREHCALQTKQHMQRQLQQDLLEPATCAPSLPPISLVVSSSNWHWSSAEGNDISAPHKADITARLRRIASLPCQLLEANARLLSQMKDVDCEPLYSLDHGKGKGTDLECGKGKATARHEELPDDDKTSVQESSATTRPRTSLPSQSESKRVSGPASRQAQSQRVSGPASRHELRKHVPTNPQLRADESADETLNAAIRTLEREREDVYTKRATEIFHHDSANRACIQRYLQQLVQPDTSQNDRLSVGSYVDSASGEVRRVDGESVALELLASCSFLDECNKSAKTVMEDLRCPISGGLLQDPVTCSDGRTYERAFIVQVFRQAEIAFEEQKTSVDPRTIFEFKSPITKQALEFKLEKGVDRRELKFNGEIREELRVKNQEICDKIKQFKESKLAELSNLKLKVEGEEDKNILCGRFGASQAGSSSETQGELPGEVFETAKTFFDWIVARSRAGLACLTGPPASGKTVTMQQIVHAAVQDCGAQMDIDGSMPLLPLFMRAAVVSKLMSKCDRWTLSGTDREPDQLLGEVISEFLDHAIKEGIFQEESKTVILELYEYGRVFICIDGLDEAAAHQELLEVCIEHAVKSAQHQSQRRLHVLLSTREHSYIHSRACLRLGDFDVVHLQKLNKARQRKMIEARIASDKVDAFCQQLAAIASKHQELTTSPFMLSLMIEVYRKEDKIPTQRVELYEKQVTALVSRCIDGRLRDRDVDTGGLWDRDVGSGGLRDKKRELASIFLETLAFVCQMRLARRDFKLEDCASHMSELWQDTADALSEAEQLLFTSPAVGLLADVGGNSYRFNHLTLQEYLAAKCFLRQFECAGALTLLEHLRGESLFSPWKREVLQFIACMLREEMFPEFCQVFLEMDDGTGACCELVKDFLNERGPSEAVERMLRDQMQKIRDTDLLLAGLCHPCPEMRSLVLSEMSQFHVPPNPFAHETVPKLKEIAADKRAVWHKRAAAMLSLAQIAQMKHCSRSDRAETIRWMLKMLQSESDVLENMHFALVKGLGTMLQKGGVSAAGGGIMLHLEDESVLLQPGLRACVAVANALGDLKIYSAGLVDWLDLEPSPIAQGQWPIRHVHFLCENAAASNDSQRAWRLVNSLLHRLHSSSFQTSERALLLIGLFAVHALVAADGWSQVLPFLESGDAEQRARVLEAAVEINVRFEGEDATSRLARCLLLEMGATRAHERSDTSLLSYVLKREAKKYSHSSLRERSNVFVFLVNIMGQSTGDSQQAVSQYLTDFEKAHVGEKSKAEEKTKEKEEQGGSGMQRLLTTSASSIDRHLQEFLPGILDQEDSGTATDVCERYCAASLWKSSGLVQETQAEKIAGWLLLREDEPARVVKAFEDLKHLQEPWMQGREGADGKWERQVLEALQLGTLGRFIFAMLLQYVRAKVMREPSSALEGFTLLSETIRQWDAETDEKRLEQQLLLKELCIGRRNEHLPSWSGDVTNPRRDCAARSSSGAKKLEDVKAIEPPCPSFSFVFFLKFDTGAGRIAVRVPADGTVADACAAAEASGVISGRLGKRRIRTFSLPDGCELVAGDRIASVVEEGEELRPVFEEAVTEALVDLVVGILHENNGNMCKIGQNPQGGGEMGDTMEQHVALKATQDDAIAASSVMNDMLDAEQQQMASEGGRLLTTNASSIDRPLLSSRNHEKSSCVGAQMVAGKWTCFECGFDFNNRFVRTCAECDAARPE